jgi:uncharacterized protein (TIGR02594 family)
MNITAFDIAQRYIGIKEVAGDETNHAILAMLKLDGDWPEDDEVPWCSAFMNHVAWLLRLPRSKSLRARSWLLVGTPINHNNDRARVGFDVVILQRGGGDQPGPEIIKAPGHVGLFAGWEDDHVLLLGGNQRDGVNIGRYGADRILGIRRLLNDQ